ncbi:MAG: type III-B CRISPR module RAMP protein Cmr4 [Saprospiraceae bacterium]|nr:type III-B CRISPR module RAMP protein Cmr4 [Saprospiraceae bacterium]MCF8249249.1 type III-B CRISPR module RAMP protein Cmr4 [Saprospiraceae bacterium]MCF8281183.1 type III-B CRISPR module RAMP protein Cmr4 [Bacteroidales bacterium]MCF8311474.1 type III-B CRISPR module RAMP protein Cmr4 [Saprospiraceae bacterium]MCF8439868.1 type III-B CRISPR module RAMP protein Cmr4 [Saprospiraceae bacterium]
MFQLAKPIFFICETPLHAGAGGGIGTELPIQREEYTHFPKIEASGIKGALREVFEKQYPKRGLDENMIAVFGHPKEGDLNAGALGLTDGRLLLFPVRSRQGVFAWATCPRVLIRFARDLYISGENGGGQGVKDLQKLVEAIPKGKSTVPTNSEIGMPIKTDNTKGNVFLEEYSINVEEDVDTGTLATTLAILLNIPELPGQFVVIPDEYFSDFVQHNTEIHTRIRIGDNGVVEDGALFSEEHLPAESVLYTLAMAHPEFKNQGMSANKILEIFEKGLPSIVQIGGNATLGKGIVRITKDFLKNQ